VSTSPAIVLRDQATGRFVTVDMRGADRRSRSIDLEDLRRGDLVSLSGHWRGGVFTAYRVEGVNSGRGLRWRTETCGILTGMQALREQIVYALEGEGAHPGFNDATNGLGRALQGKRPEGAAHSPWELLEHMRLAQLDILQFTRNDPDYAPLDFPHGYWPRTPEPPDERSRPDYPSRGVILITGSLRGQTTRTPNS